MYRLNHLMRNVLITTDEVIFHAPTKQTLDPRTIQNSIIIAEERFIRPALDFDMYYELADSKNVVVTNANKAILQANMVGGVVLKEGDVVNAFEQMSSDNQKLWKEHLWKLTAECVMLIAFPEGFVQFSSEGVIHTSPIASPLNTTGVSTPELKSMKWAMDKKQQDRIDPLLESLHDYICRNKAKYLKYKKECPCDNETRNVKRSDLVLGLYDDIDQTPGCGCYD